MTEDNKEILVRFGSILREVRTAKAFTLLELEVRTGINEGDLSKIENGKKNFNFTTLVKLSQGLEEPLSRLLSHLHL